MVGPCCKASAGRVEPAYVRWTRGNLINQDIGSNRWCFGNLWRRFAFVMANSCSTGGDLCGWRKVVQAEIGYLSTRRAVIRLAVALDFDGICAKGFQASLERWS
jgi:hypothetical protein